jgi:hypothetical protein
MGAIQFQTEHHGGASIALPPDVAAQSPKTGHATVVVMVQSADSEDAAWRMSAYEQFMAGEDESDDVYDAYQ